MTMIVRRVSTSRWFKQAAVLLAATATVSLNAPTVLATEAPAKTPPAATSKDASSAFDPGFQKVRAKKLEALFKRLKTAQSPQSANAITGLIWQTWMTSGNINIDFLLRQSRMAIREGSVQEAYGALDRVIKIAPNFAEGWNRRATLHYMQGRYRDSVADILKTLELEPRHFGALSGLGMIYMAEKRWGAALKAYEKALEVNPWLHNGKALLKELKRRADGQAL